MLALFTELSLYREKCELVHKHEDFNKVVSLREGEGDQEIAF